MNYPIFKIQEHPQLKDISANWFHNKWDIPFNAYQDSMEQCILQKSTVPQWYVVMDNAKIIGGCSIIENDFHNRKDLTPNICAVYIEKEYRCQGIAV